VHSGPTSIGIDTTNEIIATTITIMSDVLTCLPKKHLHPKHNEIMVFVLLKPMMLVELLFAKCDIYIPQA